MIEEKTLRKNIKKQLKQLNGEVYERSIRYDKIKSFKDAEKHIEELYQEIDSILEKDTEDKTTIWIGIIFLFFMLFLTIVTVG